MKPLLLFTPPHSGTHYTRLFLELHPQISSPWVISEAKVGERTFGTYIRDFFDGKLTARRLALVAADAEILKGHHEFRDRWFREKLSLTLKPKEPEYILLHAHTALRFQGDLEAVECLEKPREPIAVVTSLRDPMLSIFTCLIRYEGQIKPKLAADSIARAYASARTMGGHIIPLGTRAAGQELLGAMDSLGLPIDEEQVKYLKRAYAVNATLSGDLPLARAIALSAPAWVYEARREYDRGVVAEDMEPWAEALRAAQLQPWLESVGYEGLPWYT